MGSTGRFDETFDDLEGIYIVIQIFGTDGQTDEWVH